MQLLNLLADGNFHSGQVLSEHLGLTRAAIWKQIQKLKSQGVPIEAVSGRGYFIPQGLDLLDQANINQIAPQFSTTVLSTVDSTNNYLMTEIKNKKQLTQGTAVVAEYQTKGRGRLGRNWVSPYGCHLYFSLYWSFTCEFSKLSGLSLAIGVIVATVLKTLGVENIQVKWPNDLVVGNKKLGGILVETTQEAEGLIETVIGIGVNCKAASDLSMIEQPCICLEEIIGQRICRQRVLIELLEKLRSNLLLFSKQGFGVFLSDWEKLDNLYGQKIKVWHQDNVKTGIMMGVDENGGLCLQLDSTSQIEKISAGVTQIRVDV